MITYGENNHTHEYENNENNDDNDDNDNDDDSSIKYESDSDTSECDDNIIDKNIYETTYSDSLGQLNEIVDVALQELSD